MKFSILVLTVSLILSVSVAIDSGFLRGFLSNLLKLRDDVNDYENDPELARSAMKELVNMGNDVVKKGDKGVNCAAFLHYFDKLDTVCTFYARQDIQQTSDIVTDCASLYSIKNDINTKKLC